MDTKGKEGWTCPKCSTVHAPTTETCKKCSVKEGKTTDRQIIL